LLVRKIFLRKKQNRDHSKERNVTKNLFWREKSADSALSRSAGEISQFGGDYHEESPCDARYRFVSETAKILNTSAEACVQFTLTRLFASRARGPLFDGRHERDMPHSFGQLTNHHARQHEWLCEFVGERPSLRTILCHAFCEALEVRLCRRLNPIWALMKRQSLQTADHLVADPTVDADANNRN
jgi:hypothetical protein